MVCDWHLINSRTMHNSKRTVFPEPVGEHTTNGLSLYMTYKRQCKFRLLKPLGKKVRFQCIFYSLIVMFSVRWWETQQKRYFKGENKTTWKFSVFLAYFEHVFTCRDGIGVAQLVKDSMLQVFCKTAVLKKLIKLTRKHLLWRQIFNEGLACILTRTWPPSVDSTKCSNDLLSRITPIN